MGAIDPQGVVSLDPRGLIARIYVGDHFTLLHATYVSCGASWFQRFFKFSHYKSMGAIAPQDIGSLGPRGLIGMIYVGGH